MHRGELIAIYGPAEEGRALKLLVGSDARRPRPRRPRARGRAPWPSAPSTACTPDTAPSSARAVGGGERARPHDARSSRSTVTRSPCVDASHQPRLLTPAGREDPPDRRAGSRRARDPALRRGARGAHAAGVLPRRARAAPCRRGSSSSARTSPSAPAAPATPPGCAPAAKRTASRPSRFRSSPSTARPISSTRIRRLLHEGELEEVREILGRPPSATGRVVPGDQRGRTLGVPTANVDVEAGTIFPGRGVYAARVHVGERWYRGAVNIGHNPTFRSRERGDGARHGRGLPAGVQRRHLPLRHPRGLPRTASATSGASPVWTSSSSRCAATSPSPRPRRPSLRRGGTGAGTG